MHFTAMAFQDALCAQWLVIRITWKWDVTVGGVIHNIPIGWSVTSSQGGLQEQC